VGSNLSGRGGRVDGARAGIGRTSGPDLRLRGRTHGRTGIRRAIRACAPPAFPFEAPVGRLCRLAGAAAGFAAPLRRVATARHPDHAHEHRRSQTPLVRFSAGHFWLPGAAFSGSPCRRALRAALRSAAVRSGSFRPEIADSREFLLAHLPRFFGDPDVRSKHHVLQAIGTNPKFAWPPARTTQTRLRWSPSRLLA